VATAVALLCLALTHSALAQATHKGPKKTFVLEGSADGRLDLYEPGYFISWFEHNTGVEASDNEQVRIHLPVRYQVGDWDRAFDWIPGDWLAHLYFAFTQDAFWNLYDDSAPFYENNFAPEAYLYLWQWDWLVASSFGVKHHSNGRSAELSRSWNRYYGSVAFGDPLKNAIFGAATLWGTWGVAEDNEDITDKLGHGELRLSFVPGAIWTPTRFGLDRLALQLKTALFGDKLVQNLGASLIVRIWKQKELFAPSLFVQYFDGAGEMLRDYERHSSTWRFGVAIAP
jgi:phospholipase A1